MESRMGYFVGWGALLWLVATVFFRLLGQFFLDPGSPGLVAATFVATVPLIAVVTYPVYTERNVRPGERPVAAVCITLPGMLLDVLSLSFFGTAFPNLSGTAGALFGAWILWAYGLVLVTGLFPRRSPQGA